MLDKASWLIESNTAGLVKLLMEDRGLSMPIAMRELYSLQLYNALADKETGLHLESPSYLYELYKQMETAR